MRHHILSDCVSKECYQTANNEPLLAGIYYLLTYIQSAREALPSQLYILLHFSTGTSYSKVRIQFLKRIVRRGAFPTININNHSE